MQLRHLIGPEDLSVEETKRVLDLAARISGNLDAYAEVAKRKKIATLFYEPSTRTRLSFETAMLNLGGNVIGFPSANVSSVNKGETVEFIGSTGSGKSTLINLIPRFYDVTGGEVLVDGINVKEYNQNYLHSKFGYVSQKAVIFNESIKENVAYGDSGKEISNEAIEKAIEVSQAKEFIDKMDNGIDTEIARGGTNISGGQKQRLSIARAVEREPEIYIFDDTFSALDYKTDSVLRKELKKYTKDATILIVAQRIGTIMNADKIIVLDDGKTVGIGTHKELLKNCEVYKQIALSQLSKEELENA